ncbi:MAG: hypothetical protein ACRDLS_01970 [Solirubrobacteraceae bacterium]
MTSQTATATIIASETPHTALPARVSPAQTHASGVHADVQRRVPLTMPRSQEYYWRSVWQQAERANLAELAAGQGIRFDSGDPEDAARWLDAPDDTDAD